MKGLGNLFPLKSSKKLPSIIKPSSIERKFRIEDMNYKNILVPTEHLKDDYIILKAAFDIASTHNATVTVLHLNLPQPNISFKINHQKATISKINNKSTNKNFTRQVEVLSKVIQKESITNTIIEESRKFDLVILAPNRMSSVKTVIEEDIQYGDINFNSKFMMITAIRN